MHQTPKPRQAQRQRAALSLACIFAITMLHACGGSDPAMPAASIAALGTGGELLQPGDVFCPADPATFVGPIHPTCRHDDHGG